MGRRRKFVKRFQVEIYHCSLPIAVPQSPWFLPTPHLPSSLLPLPTLHADHPPHSSFSHLLFHALNCPPDELFLGADVDGPQVSTMGTHTHLELHL